ncbi:MAG: CmcI family methyltransferase [Candidatus Omnitrophota bacterium]
MEKNAFKKDFLWKKTSVPVGLIVVLSVVSMYCVIALARYEFLSDRKIIERFIQLYYRSKVWNSTKWLGIPSVQNPCDMWAMQEIITEVKPDFIVETGTYKGGSSLFYASVLEGVHPRGKVITVDIESYVRDASRSDTFKKHVEFIQGDSVSPEVIRVIAERVKGHKVMVTLDSLHTKEHVLKEMERYSPLVSVGSYLVVQDTIASSPSFSPLGLGGGPLEAVGEFLAKNDNFVIDRTREKFLLTFYPSGYLKRVR